MRDELLPREPSPLPAVRMQTEIQNPHFHVAVFDPVVFHRRAITWVNPKFVPGGSAIRISIVVGVFWIEAWWHILFGRHIAPPYRRGFNEERVTEACSNGSQ